MNIFIDDKFPTRWFTKQNYFSPQVQQVWDQLSAICTSGLATGNTSSSHLSRMMEQKEKTNDHRFFHTVFFLRYQCLCNHGEACEVVGIRKAVSLESTAVIFFLWRCQWIVGVRELPWQDEQRARDARGSLSTVWNPFVELYRVSPRHWLFHASLVCSSLCLFIFAKWQL